MGGERKGRVCADARQTARWAGECPALRDSVVQGLFSAQEDATRINDDKDGAAAGKNGPVLIGNLGAAREPATALADFAGLDPEAFVQRHGPEVFHVHLGSGGDHVTQFTQLAHGFVENSGDDSAVAVAGRACVAAAKAKNGDESLVFPVQKKLQMHTVQIVFSASEAEVFSLWIGFASVSGP
jgi:hypothetical protein